MHNLIRFHTVTAQGFAQPYIAGWLAINKSVPLLCCVALPLCSALQYAMSWEMLPANSYDELDGFGTANETASYQRNDYTHRGGQVRDRPTAAFCCATDCTASLS